MRWTARLALVFTLALLPVGCGESEPADSAADPATPAPTSRGARSPRQTPAAHDREVSTGSADKYAQVVAGQTLEEVEAILGPADATMGETERVIRFWTKPNDDEFSVLFVDGIAEEIKTHEMP